MKKWILLFLFFNFFFSGIAQMSNIKFDHINIKDGLSQSDVTSILQGSKGLMWFGTKDGLNVYNGYDVEVFSYDLVDTSSISNDYIHDILETKDQVIWVGTENGLNIFDRSSRTFKNIFHKTSVEKAKNSVWTMAEGTDNNVWIGTDEQLFRVDKSSYKISNVKLNLSVISRYLKIRKILFIDNDKLLIATEGNGIIELNTTSGLTKQYYTENSNIKSNVIWDFLLDKENNLWVLSDNGINLFNPEKGTFSSNSFLDDSIGEEVIKTICEDKSGFIWIGTENKGLYKLKSLTSIEHYVYNSNISTGISSNRINKIYEDDYGIIWVGTQSGIDKFNIRKQYMHHYQHWPNTENSISSNKVFSFYEEGEGNKLWIGTSEGVDIFNRNTQSITTLVPDFSGSKLQKNSGIYAIFKDHNNQFLLGTDGGLQFVKDKKSISPLFKQDLGRVHGIVEDDKNRLWLATKEGLVIVSEDRKNIQTITSLDSVNVGLPSDGILSIIKDHNESIWIGTDGGGLCKVIEEVDRISFKVYQKRRAMSNSLSSNSILSIYEDKEGYLWIGTFGGGINKFDPKKEEFKVFTKKEGLSNNVVYGILEDKKNHLWLSTNKGISKFDKKTYEFKNYDQSDGLQGNEFNMGAYLSSGSGELIFGGVNGFNIFYPDDIYVNKYEPKLLITDFYLFNEPVEIGENSVLKKHISEFSEWDEINLTHKQNIISFQFAALHYSNPQKNQHAYMLENFDEDWVYVGSNRRANYTNLAPGEYVFKVKVANGDGLWSSQVARVKIDIKPPFWYAWWFILVVCILFPLGLIYAYVIARINRVKAQKMLLELQVRERTHEVLKQKEEIENQKKLVELEKEKADKLLFNILPQETAEELKAKGKATARQYRLSSIMFTDFKRFTKIAEEIKPQELVAELDSYFIKFDEIIEKYDVEKIKTIGDAYMCAGGIPIRNKSNPIDIVLAGLEIQRFVKTYNQKKESEGKKGWDLRVGIHTGEIIAGVIGTKRFAYDIWGDSVNIGSRIEAAGDAGKVNISGATYELVKEFFTCEYRGEVKAKNKGFIDMYFVHAIKPELSVDGEGIIPNELFQKYVDLHIYSSINYRKAEKYIMKRLEKELPDNLHYHDIRHTKDVCAAVERLALMEGIEGDDIFLLKTAAQYHDAGFIEQYANNEDIGAALAQEVLPRFGYTQEQIETVGRLIQATKVPQKPKNHLEQIICDADLDYLGGDEFHIIADKLKRELKERDIIKSDKQWDELQITFLESHTYFTKTAIELRQANKLERIKEIKERLKTYK